MKKCVAKHVRSGSKSDYEVCDIHAHAIPGVDDGARSFDMAMGVMRMAYSQGTKHIVCTSHDGYNTKKYFRNLKTLQRKINRAKLGITLHPGCEIYCCVRDMEYIVDSLNRKIIPTMNNTKYVLVEFSPRVHIGDMVYCLKYLHESGYNTIIAHVERYHVLRTSSQWVKLLLRMGCLLQVNAYSFVDTEDQVTKAFAQRLLEEKAVFFVGSDTHGTDYRPYAIKNGIDYIYENCDAEYAKNICYQNAKNMLNM